MKILVVEDDPIAAKIAEMIIRRTRSTADLTISKTGEHALALCQKEAFDLILLDIGLPDCSGYNIALNVKTLEHQDNTPIYMLSAHIKAHSELCPSALSCISGFISKPLSFDKFKNILSKMPSEVG